MESRIHVKDTLDQLLAAQLGQKMHDFEFWIERDMITGLSRFHMSWRITITGLSGTLLAPNLFSDFIDVVLLPRLDHHVWLSVDRFVLIDSFFQEQLHEERLRLH